MGALFIGLERALARLDGWLMAAPRRPSAAINSIASEVHNTWANGRFDSDSVKKESAGRVPARSAHARPVARIVRGPWVERAVSDTPGAWSDGSPVASARSSGAQAPLKVKTWTDRREGDFDATRLPGRIVISGRMADVCAELERLAAMEAAQSARLARAMPAH